MPSILHEKLNYVSNKISQTDLKPEITDIWKSKNVMKLIQKG